MSRPDLAAWLRAQAAEVSRPPRQMSEAADRLERAERALEMIALGFGPDAVLAELVLAEAEPVRPSGACRVNPIPPPPGYGNGIYEKLRKESEARNGE